MDILLCEEGVSTDLRFATISGAVQHQAAKGPVSANPKICEQKRSVLD